ncbi:hypothetical protein GCM10020295_78090 [Streptomyces cinereospinus]
MDHLFTFPAVRRRDMVDYVLLGADKAGYHKGFRIADSDRIVIDARSHGIVLDNAVQYVQTPAVS